MQGSAGTWHLRYPPRNRTEEENIAVQTIHPVPRQIHPPVARTLNLGLQVHYAQPLQRGNSDTVGAETQDDL